MHPAPHHTHTQLASNADLYVNDAFGTAHRAHASTEGVTKFLSPSVAGFLLQKELDYLAGAVDAPKRPFAAIVGGSKVSSKIGVLEKLIEKCDKIIIGYGVGRSGQLGESTCGWGCTCGWVCTWSMVLVVGLHTV